VETFHSQTQLLRNPHGESRGQVYVWREKPGDAELSVWLNALRPGDNYKLSFFLVLCCQMEKNNKGQRVIPVKDLKKDQVIHQVQQVWTKQQEEIHLASMILVDSHVKAI
jgi:hypothetical protein